MHHCTCEALKTPERRPPQWRPSVVIQPLPSDKIPRLRLTTDPREAAAPSYRLCITGGHCRSPRQSASGPDHFLEKPPS
jgi:hypothetical protein